MTPHIPENVSTWLVNWMLASNSPPPRDPNDDHHEEENDEEDEDRTKNRRSSKSPRNNAPHTPTALVVTACVERLKQVRTLLPRKQVFLIES